MPAKKKNLYALLVVVDKYKEDIVLEDGIYFPQLSSCVADSKRLKAWLESDPAFDASVMILANKDATKANVVKQFHEHLGKAKKDDVALFFYSGHGTQEWADTTAWHMDTDGRLECIVCYYDDDRDEFLLADKEMRFLIHELSKQEPHILALFDCCHSTDSTRNAGPVKASFPDATEKRIPWSFPKRKWEHFIFSDKISRDEMKKYGEVKMLPEGPHVQMSACESDESALEVDGRGVLTKAFLQVLKSTGGDVDYLTMQSRIRQYLKNSYEQKPHVYAGAGKQELLKENFLGRPSTGAKRSIAEMVYNEDYGWKLTLGAIHGIEDENRNVLITDPEDNSKSYGGILTKVEIDSSFVETDAKLKTSKVYNVAVDGLMLKQLKLHVENEGQPLLKQQKLLDALLETNASFFELEEDIVKADYVLRASEDQYNITRNDNDHPLTASIKAGKARSIDDLLAKLKHISQWEFLKDLSNKRGTYLLTEDAVKIELVSGSTKKSLLNAMNEAIIEYEKVDGLWKNSISVKLTNTSSVNIYCAALYLTSSFAADIDFLNPTVYLLEPGNSVELSVNGDPLLELELSEVVKFFRKKEEVEYLKFIFSTTPFDVQALVLEALPLPDMGEDSKGADAKVKDVIRGVKKHKPRGWTTKTITLRLQNPKKGQSAKPPLSRGGDPDQPEKNILVPKMGNGGSFSKGLESQSASMESDEPEMAGSAPESVGAEMETAMPRSAPPGGGNVEAVAEEIFQQSPAPARDKEMAAPPKPLSREGQMEYDIPGQMQTGKAYTCKINIAGNEVEAGAMKIGEASVHSALRVSDEMSVRLIDTSGGDHFEINNMSTERQGIFAGEVTSWIFNVEPKKSGNHPLVLKITMHMDGRNKDLDILEKEVVVMASADGAGTTALPDITRILFISANPLDTAQLRIGAETRQIREEIGLAANRDKFVFTINLGVTTRTLSRAILQEDPAIVHFSGHGEEEGLCLETETGVTKLVENKALGLLFKNFSKTIKCVILNACFSESQAKVIAEHIPFVIGMKKEVKDSVALAFSVAFYQALADGSDPESAFNMGLAGMAMVAEGEQDVAVLVKSKV